MSVLKERLLEQQQQQQQQQPRDTSRATGDLRASNELQELKARVHRILINKLDLSKLENANPDVARKFVRKAIERILDEENAPLSGVEREQVQTYMLNELFDLAPLGSPLDAEDNSQQISVETGATSASQAYEGWRSNKRTTSSLSETLIAFYLLVSALAGFILLRAMTNQELIVALGTLNIAIIGMWIWALFRKTRALTQSLTPSKGDLPEV